MGSNISINKKPSKSSRAAIYSHSLMAHRLSDVHQVILLSNPRNIHSPCSTSSVSSSSLVLQKTRDFLTFKNAKTKKYEKQNKQQYHQVQMRSTESEWVREIAMPTESSWNDPRGQIIPTWTTIVTTNSSSRFLENVSWSIIIITKKRRALTPGASTQRNANTKNFFFFYNSIYMFVTFIREKRASSPSRSVAACHLLSAFIFLSLSASATPLFVI